MGPSPWHLSGSPPSGGLPHIRHHQDGFPPSLPADHLTKARALGLPHVKYFEEAYKQGSMTLEDGLMVLVQNLLEMDPELFSSKEWRYSEWVKENSPCSD